MLCKKCYKKATFDYYFGLTDIYIKWVMNTEKEPKDRYKSFKKYSKLDVSIEDYKIVDKMIEDMQDKIENGCKLNKNYELTEKDIETIIKQNLKETGIKS